MPLRPVPVPVLPLARLREVVGEERYARLQECTARVRATVHGRQVLNVNSTASGGGVAEMLQTLLGYVRDTGIDVRWSVIQASPEFFGVTKRIHHSLYGSAGDGGGLGARERAVYESVLAECAHDLRATIRPGDVVVLHDPQTAGLVPHAQRLGAHVVWRCHVGSDRPGEHCRRGWEFLRPYLEQVPVAVFSRRAFAPDWLDDARVREIAPSIDPGAPKNQPLDDAFVAAVLAHTGLVAPPAGVTTGPLGFRRRDGSPGRVERRADVLQAGPPPPAEAPLVVQVSRWDRQKDMAGVLTAFADHIAARDGAHLVLAGPNVSSVADDPEGPQVLQQCMGLWRRLPHALRARVHLACLPTADVDENAVIVNALQRHAAVVTQKSLAEGFGLTVAEAMWKERPVVASRVGGIGAQIVDGESGLLIDDPADLAAFGAAVGGLLDDPATAARIGRAARARVDRCFLPDRHLRLYADLVSGVITGDPSAHGSATR